MLGEIGDGLSLGVLGRQGQQAHGLLLHRAQHLSGIHPADHPVKLVVLQLVAVVVTHQPAVGHAVERHPVDVKRIVHTGHIELGRRHQRRHRCVHLRHRFQLRAGQIAADQGESGGPVLTYAHGQHVKGHGRGNVALIEGRA